MTWLIAILCVSASARRWRRVARIPAPLELARLLKRELSAGRGAAQLCELIVKRGADAPAGSTLRELSESLSGAAPAMALGSIAEATRDLEHELGKDAMVPSAAARISLATGTLVTLFAAIAALRGDFNTQLPGLVTIFVGGVCGGLVSAELGRRAHGRVRVLREGYRELFETLDRAFAAS